MAWLKGELISLVKIVFFLQYFEATLIRVFILIIKKVLLKVNTLYEYKM